MDDAKRDRAVCIACSIFKNELERLRSQGRFFLDTDYLDSALHLYPQELQTQLDRAIKTHRQQQDKILLLFGDCHAYMCDYADEPGIARIKGVNCCQIVLEAQEYQGLHSDGAFFLLPEWALRWQEIIKAYIGLPQAQAQEFMREMHSGFIYVDTGIVPVPVHELDALAEFFGLTVTIKRVGLEPFLLHIQHVLQELDR